MAGRFRIAGCMACFWRATAQGKPVRVGELDEEMVFESRKPATRSSWALRRGGSKRLRMTGCWCRRRRAIPGKMPFWHGDRAGGRWSLGGGSARWCGAARDAAQWR
jgi:hypothetical protein